MLVNPVNAPRMYQNYIRTMTVEDKKIIDKIYSSLADLSVLSLDLEIESNEKEEAELIKKSFDIWNSSKPEFKKILNSMKHPKDFVNKKERSYFG